MRYNERALVAEVRRLSLRDLRLWVREGWMRPSLGEDGPVFDDVDVARARLLCDLTKDMALSNDVLPIILSLIDNLHRTRRDLRRLTEAIETLPDEAQRSVLVVYRSLEDDPDGSEDPR